jgi:hypothetical protein
VNNVATLKVLDPDNVDAQLALRCAGEYVNAFSGVEVAYYNATSKQCETKVDCQPGTVLSACNGILHSRMLLLG